jgi:hypothetical protein
MTTCLPACHSVDRSGTVHARNAMSHSRFGGRAAQAALNRHDDVAECRCQPILPAWKVQG